MLWQLFTRYALDESMQPFVIYLISEIHNFTGDAINFLFARSKPPGMVFRFDNRLSCWTLRPCRVQQIISLAR